MPIRSLTFDVNKTVRGKFKPSTAAERQFYRQLKKVAQASGHIVDQHRSRDAGISDAKRMQRELERYSEKLEPWAVRQAAKMLETVEKSNKRAYTNKSRAIGAAFQAGAGDVATAEAALVMLNEQVKFIQSIPVEAGLRAQKIAYEAVLAGSRAEVNADTVRQLEQELDLTTEVATSRAMLIARTETARATAVINQTRAQSVGSSQYRWHNSGDEAVRHSHKFYKGKRLQGMIFSWSHPPTLDDGMTGHPGTFPNCRCFAEPIFEDE